MYLFNEDIGSWDDWGRVFQSIAVFEPLVGAIMKEEKLAFDRIYNLTPGTNAVFRVGGVCVKNFLRLKNVGEGRTGILRRKYLL